MNHLLYAAVESILDLPFSPLWAGAPAVVPASMRIAAPGDYPAPSGPGGPGEGAGEGLLARLRELGYLD